MQLWFDDVAWLRIKLILNLLSFNKIIVSHKNKIRGYKKNYAKNGNHKYSHCHT
jgi:hypothetical protein